jgi:casein kinase II subunit beta
MDLYGLIHQRFILTKKGLLKMKLKYHYSMFGTCPRVLCEQQDTVPIGMKEELSISRVKIFCPKCEEVYVPRNKFVDVDGAYFGQSFPIIFFQTFPELIPDENKKLFVPKIYGFKIFGMVGSKYEHKTLSNTKDIKDKSKNKNKNIK